MVSSAASAAGTGASSTQVAKVFDPRDTNKDGRVSFMEQLMYDFKHPDKVKKTNEKNTTTVGMYDKSGNKTTANQSTILDLLI